MMNFQQKIGLYDPSYEHDACGVGFVVNIDGTKSHDIVEKGVEVLEKLLHLLSGLPTCASAVEIFLEGG